MEEYKSKNQPDAENEPKYKISLTNRSYFLLPVLFVLTLVIGICFKVVDDFKEGVSLPILWTFFGVAIVYLIIANIDNFYNRKEKKFKLILIASILTLLSNIFFVVMFYI